MSDERVVCIVQRYQRRLANNNKWAKRYYEVHADSIKAKKLLAGIAKGRCPSRTTIERLAVDREALKTVWVEYVSGLSTLSERARDFHRYLVGSEWEPRCV